MEYFDPASMSETTSPTVRSLRTFVERTMESEIEKVEKIHGNEIASIVENSLRSVVFSIFHKNPEVHTKVKEDQFAFDAAIQQLFAITNDNVSGD